MGAVGVFRLRVHYAALSLKFFFHLGDCCGQQCIEYAGMYRAYPRSLLTRPRQQRFELPRLRVCAPH